MWKKWKESDFVKKLKQVRVNRAVYISAVVILLALSIVLAVTVATNRSKKKNADTTDTLPPVTDQQPTPDDANPTPDNTPEDSEPTLGSVPELALPTAGTLTKKHTVETQVFSPTMGDYRIHLGIDIETEANAPVCAVADGTVEQIWEDPMMGWCLAVSHSGECVTVYKNLAKDLAEGITVGTAVAEGQLLGNVGDTAMMEIAEEPHLHMEMTVKGLQVDPLDYFSTAVLETLTENSIYESELEK
ncbi:MAG: M23 family metallopeptidase [Clostridia bacterium]|nr:M23 family metallopeptidase [Clostridia bacterium]